MKRAASGELYPCSNEAADVSREADFVNYVCDLPSLQNIALVSIAVRLWGNVNMSEIVKANNYETDEEHEEDFQRLEENVAAKLAEISLPDSLKFKVSQNFRTIGVQLFQWFFLGEKNYCNFRELREKGGSIYWTMEGNIDKIRSLKEIINSPRFLSNDETYFSSLYQLACKYCLEECIPDLWQKVSDKDSEFKNVYLNYRENITGYWIAVQENSLPTLLIKLKQNDMFNIYDNNVGIYENMISVSVLVGNAVSLKYFWRKLSKIDITANIDEWLERAISVCRMNRFFERYFYYHGYSDCSDIMFFLLSQLDDHLKQLQVFKSHSELILRHLFHHWPLQKFFLPTINVMFNFLPGVVYVNIMNMIACFKEKITLHVLLRKIWNISPSNLKRAFLAFLMTDAKAVVRLLKNGDHVTLNLILKDCSAKQRGRIKRKLFKEHEFYQILSSNPSAISMVDAFASKGRIRLLNDKRIFENSNENA